MSIDSPLDIADLRVWYAAGYEATLYADGDTVTDLHDLSGNGYDAVTMNTGRPTLDMDGGEGGSPAIVWSTSSDSWTVIDAAALSGATEGSIFVGWNPDTVSGFNGPWFFNNSSAGAHHPFSGTIYESFLTNYRYSYSPPTDSESFHTYGVVSQAGTGGSECYWNGSSAHTEPTTFEAANGTIYFATNSSNNRWFGRLAVLLIFDRALTDTEMSDLHDWLIANPSGYVEAGAAPEVTLTATMPAFAGDLELTNTGCAYYDAVQADDPWAFWLMNEPSGSTLIDIRNGHDMTITGSGLTFEEPGPNDCSPAIHWPLSTNPSVGGTYKYAQTADTLSAGPSTVEAWVKLEAYPSGTDGDSIITFASGGAGDSTTDKALWIDEDGHVVYSIYDAASPFINLFTTDTLDLGAWYHIVGLNGGGTMQVRVNGEEWASVASNDSYTGWSIPAVLHGGVRNFPYYEFRFAQAMTIGPVAVWGSKLTSDQTDAHYAASVPSEPEVTLTATVPAFTGDFDLVSTPQVFLDALMPGFVAGIELHTNTEVQVHGVMPGFTGDFLMAPEAQITLTATVPAFRGDIALAFPPTTDTSNRVGGRTRSGIGVATWDPPVAPVPVPYAPMTPPRARVVAQAFNNIAISGRGTPTYDVTLAERGGLRDRIVVGNTDVTYFRGTPTPFPGYGLTEPLLYGPTSLTFPQIAAPFEQPGAGALSWLRIGKQVLFQRVDPDTETVVYEDYVGVVVGFDVDGPAMVVQVGGEAMGRAGLVNRQVPIWTSMQDIGRYMYSAFKDLGLRLTPYLGPTTGVRLQRFGGQSVLDYISELVARSWNRQGNRWTVMPDHDADTRGVYKMRRKDTTTIDATAYVDDTRVRASLHRDAAEEPNRIFGTGITPNGMRVRNGVYPGLKQTAPAPYPYDDHDQDFGIGTTNGDTDTGDGITVMIQRLIITKYLDQEDTPGGYDARTARAIRNLQEDAGRDFQSGVMDFQTWQALYDLDVTGYSLRWSHIEPMAQRRAVRKWNRSGTGAVMGRNPYYNESLLKVDRNIDFGTGLTSDAQREWARAELGEAEASNWVGSIAFPTGALLVGEVNPGDAAGITEADVLPARNLRPGQNIWLPTFDGGTLVHIAACNVGADGMVSVDVDTRARDAMEVWEVIARNRDSRNSPARAWAADHRSSTMTKDSIGIWDEVGGTLGDDVPVPANVWTVFPVVAGQEGTVRSLRVRTSPAAEYVMAVFGDTIYGSRLQRLIGNPLTHAGKLRWASESIRDELDRTNVLLYVAGEKAAPCGYYPLTKAVEDDPDTPDEETGTNPLTGRWEDDAGFSYHTGEHPVLWVAVYADRATSVPHGRIMFNQLEAGV